MNALDWLFPWRSGGATPPDAAPVMARWGETLGVARFRGVWTIPSFCGDVLAQTPAAWTPLKAGAFQS